MPYWFVFFRGEWSFIVFFIRLYCFVFCSLFVAMKQQEVLFSEVIKVFISKRRGISLSWLYNVLGAWGLTGKKSEI